MLSLDIMSSVCVCVSPGKTTENWGVPESSCSSVERRSFFWRGSESSSKHTHTQLPHVLPIRGSHLYIKTKAATFFCPDVQIPLGGQCSMMLPSLSWVSVTDLTVSNPAASSSSAAELIMHLRINKHINSHRMFRMSDGERCVTSPAMLYFESEILLEKKRSGEVLSVAVWYREILLVETRNKRALILTKSLQNYSYFKTNCIPATAFNYHTSICDILLQIKWQVPQE